MENKPSWLMCSMSHKITFLPELILMNLLYRNHQDNKPLPTKPADGLFGQTLVSIHPCPLTVKNQQVLHLSYSLFPASQWKSVTVVNMTTQFKFPEQFTATGVVVFCLNVCFGFPLFNLRGNHK